MAAPTLTGGVVANNVTTTTAFVVASAGDVVVVSVASGDAVTIKSSVTGGTGTVQSANATMTSSTQVSLGTADFVENDGSGHVVQFWLLKVVSGSAINVNALIDTGFATGAGRRWSMWKITPPTGYHFDPAVMLARTCSGANTGGAGSGNVTQTWTGSAVTVPEILIAAAMTASGTVGTWDADASGGTGEVTGAASSSDGNHFGATYDTVANGGTARPDQATTIYVGPNAAKSCAAIVLQATTIKITPGVAAETDGGIKLTTLRSFVAKVATETDSGITIAPFHGHVIGLAQQSVAALTFVVKKTLAIGTATETDGGLHVQRAVTIGTAGETDVPTASPWTKLQPAKFGPFNDLGDGPFTYFILRAWMYLLGGSDIADVRLSLYNGATLLQQGAWQPLTGTPTAYTLKLDQTLAAVSNLFAEIDVRTPSSATPALSALELETDSPVQTATTTAFAFPIAPNFSHPVLTAGEANTALRIFCPRSIVLGVATETDASIAISHTYRSTEGVAAESDVAFSVVVVKRGAVGLATEPNATFPLGVVKQLAARTSSEPDTSSAVGVAKQFAIGMAAEPNIAFSTPKNPAVLVGLAGDSNAAFAVAHSHARLVSVAAETDVGLVVLPRLALIDPLVVVSDSSRRIVSWASPSRRIVTS